MLDLRLVDEAGLVELLARRRIENFFLQRGVNFQLGARHSHEIFFLFGIPACQLLELLENPFHFTMIFRQQRSRIYRFKVSFAIAALAISASFEQIRWLQLSRNNATGKVAVPGDRWPSSVRRWCVHSIGARHLDLRSTPARSPGNSE